MLDPPNWRMLDLTCRRPPQPLRKHPPRSISRSPPVRGIRERMLDLLGERLLRDGLMKAHGQGLCLILFGRGHS